MIVFLKKTISTAIMIYTKSPKSSTALNPTKSAAIRPKKIPNTDEHPLIAQTHGIMSLLIPLIILMPIGKNMPIKKAKGKTTATAIIILNIEGRYIVSGGYS
jgi:hypothetical protein